VARRIQGLPARARLVTNFLAAYVRFGPWISICMKMGLSSIVVGLGLT
jgi:hypothetical protein